MAPSLKDHRWADTQSGSCCIKIWGWGHLIPADTGREEDTTGTGIQSITGLTHTETDRDRPLLTLTFTSTGDSESPVNLHVSGLWEETHTNSSTSFNCWNPVWLISPQICQISVFSDVLLMNSRWVHHNNRLVNTDNDPDCSSDCRDLNFCNCGDCFNWVCSFNTQRKFNCQHVHTHTHARTQSKTGQCKHYHVWRCGNRAARCGAKHTYKDVFTVC